MIAGRKDQSFKGFETWMTEFKMNSKMYLHIGLLMLAVQCLITTVLSVIVYPKAWYLIVKYFGASVASLNFPALMFDFILKLAGKSFWLFFLTLPVWYFFPKAVAKMQTRAKKQSEDKFIRGAENITPEELNGRIAEDNEETDLPLGEVKMPVSAEPKHGFIIGRPGVGKTVAISAVVNRLKERKTKAVIYDFKGDFVSKFYDPSQDILFNPLDTRCRGWNIFNEISTFMDVDAVAHSLIPESHNEDKFFNEAARDVFSGILHYLYQSGAKYNSDIWNAVTAPGADIASWLKNTKGGERGYRYIEDESSRQALGVFSTMMLYVKSFEYMAKADGDFSIKRWLEDDKGSFIFVTNYSDVKDTLKPILSLFVDLLGRKLLSLKEDYNRRIFFMLDEFGTLQRLSTIVQLLTLSRSKGGSTWIGIQDIGQLDKIYTKELRESIVNACGSNLIFSVADPTTSKFLSDKIGDREFSEMEETHSMGVEDHRDGISLVRRRKTEKLVLPSEIQNLKDLNCFLKLPNYPITNTRFKYVSYPDRHEPFVMRPDLSLDYIIGEQAKILAQAKAFTVDRGIQVQEIQEKEQLDEKTPKKEQGKNNDGLEMEIEEIF